MSSGDDLGARSSAPSLPVSSTSSASILFLPGGIGGVGGGGGDQLSSVPCLQRKRVLAFFNHFVSRTAAAISDLSAQCERRMDLAERRMDALERSLALLEAQVRSATEEAEGGVPAATASRSAGAAGASSDS